MVGAGTVLAAVVYLFDWQQEADLAAARVKAVHHVHRRETESSLAELNF